MSIIQRPNSPKLYFKFSHQGKQYYRSTGTTDRKLAEQRERQFRSDLERGIPEKLFGEAVATIPAFREFASWPKGRFWTDYGEKYQIKPNTYQFYRDRIQALLKHPMLPETTLDRIDKAMIDSYVAWRLAEGRKPATINRDLAVLGRILRKALDWRLIRELPMFPRGTERLQEAKRGFVLSPEQEKVYFQAADVDLAEFALILIDTSMEPGMAAQLKWDDVGLDPYNGFEFGFIHDRCAKTKTRERDLPMTARLQEVLILRWERDPDAEYVFPAVKRGPSKPMPLSSFQSRHKRLWNAATKLTIPRFRLYDFRHTALTRLRDSGADRFELALYAGWAPGSRMADTYVHAGHSAKVLAGARLSAHLDAIFGDE